MILKDFQSIKEKNSFFGGNISWFPHFPSFLAFFAFETFLAHTNTVFPKCRLKLYPIKTNILFTLNHGVQR